MDQMDEIQRTLGKLLANQESFLDAWKQHLVDDKEVAKRVTNIESKITYATGILAVLVLAWGAASHFITRKLGLL